MATRLKAVVTRDGSMNTLVTYDGKTYFVPMAPEGSEVIYCLVGDAGEVAGYVGKYRDGYAPLDRQDYEVWKMDPSMFCFYGSFEAAVEALFEGMV